MTENKEETRGRKRLNAKLRKDTTRTMRVPIDVIDELKALVKLFNDGIINKRDVIDLVDLSRGNNDGKQ